MKQVPNRDPETATEAVHRIWGDPYEAHKPRHNCPHCRCAGADPQRLTLTQLQTRDHLVELWPVGVDRALVEVGLLGTGRENGDSHEGRRSDGLHEDLGRPATEGIGGTRVGIERWAQCLRTC